MDYQPGILSGRPIFWCPDGEGNLPFCPSPSHSDEYVYCCQFFFLLGDTYPTCCRFPIYTGLLIAYILSAVVLLLRKYETFRSSGTDSLNHHFVPLWLFVYYLKT
ncbi:unnamed protein product [Heligmosomoides polygyrus]|uniref:Dolichyl-P-Glc:Glc(2)Man(9)GlcNAc(2)-PP-dolichol alpha-1,2-glucosyltransferase n=1 Tax=Heligmosomoides polygyrus TaxID=6339 RepID=A0A183F230_HELPZ|nr:unnamed protein product [Heligmosomoides polygyrus]